MRNHLTLIVCALLLFAGCSKESGPLDPAAEPVETDGRLTIINDEAALSSRLTLLSEPVAIDALEKRSGPAEFTLETKALVEPPTVNGQKLQATSVRLKGKFAYVTYNMAGSAYSGGVDVIRVEEGADPVIISSVTFVDTDVSCMDFDGTHVYVAEATSDASFSSPAVLEAVSTKLGNKFTMTQNMRRALGSYVATSVAAIGSVAYVTTGNTGGLYVIRHDAELTESHFTPLDDARWVDIDDFFCVVVQGTPGRIAVFDRATLSPLRTIPFEGASIAESKSTIRLLGGKALVAAGDGGTKLIDLQGGTVVGSLPRPSVPGVDPADAVTNAADASGRYVYTSNGGAGIVVAKASRQLEEQTGGEEIAFTVMGRLRLDDYHSANHIAFNGSTVAIASGLGGTRIIKVTK